MICNIPHRYCSSEAGPCQPQDSDDYSDDIPRWCSTRASFSSTRFRRAVPPRKFIWASQSDSARTFLKNFCFALVLMSDGSCYGKIKPAGLGGATENHLSMNSGLRKRLWPSPNSVINVSLSLSLSLSL